MCVCVCVCVCVWCQWSVTERPHVISRASTSWWWKPTAYECECMRALSCRLCGINACCCGHLGKSVDVADAAPTFP
jgi:hypothetical protein